MPQDKPLLGERWSLPGIRPFLISGFLEADMVILTLDLKESFSVEFLTTQGTYLPQLTNEWFISNDPLENYMVHVIQDNITTLDIERIRDRKVEPSHVLDIQDFLLHHDKVNFPCIGETWHNSLSEGIILEASLRNVSALTDDQGFLISNTVDFLRQFIRGPLPFVNVWDYLGDL